MLNAHADVHCTQQARSQNFGLSLHLHPYFLLASSEGSNGVFAVHWCDKVPKSRTLAHMELFARKPCIRSLRSHKAHASLVGTEKIEWFIASWTIILSKQRKLMALIRLRGYSGCSTSLLFICIKTCNWHCIVIDFSSVRPSFGLLVARTPTIFFDRFKFGRWLIAYGI